MRINKSWKGLSKEEKKFLLREYSSFKKEVIKTPEIFEGDVESFKPSPGIENKEFILMLPLYGEKNIGRDREFMHCLDKNLENKRIKKIVVFYDTENVPKDKDNFLGKISKKNIKIVYTKGRLTYKKAFSYANTHFKNSNIILANADIYFNESLSKFNLINMDNKMFCLTRWNVYKNGKLKIAYLKNHSEKSIISQDAWIFKTPLKTDFRCDLALGLNHCDSFLNYHLKKSKLKISNPCLDVQACHYHLSDYRSADLVALARRDREYVKEQAKLGNHDAGIKWSYLLKKKSILRILGKEMDWRTYLDARPDLKKNWNSPLRVLAHYLIFERATIFFKSKYKLRKLKKQQKDSDKAPRAIFVYGLHKSATMFLALFFRELCNRRKFAFFSKNLHGISILPKFLKKNIKFSFCLCPERYFPKVLPGKNFKNIRNSYYIYQIRDPRDILVSEYFSYGWLHRTSAASSPMSSEFVVGQRKQIQNETIDEYAIRAATSLKSRMAPLVKRYKKLGANEIILKYEEMVLSLSEWIGKAIIPFNFEFSENIISSLHEQFKNEFITKGNRRRGHFKNHKRNITPGDHKDKLQAKTIKKLNKIFKEELKIFNYEKNN